MASRLSLFPLLGGSLLLLFLGIPAAADTLLVVPFENAARVPDLDWVGESFAETLMDRLGGSGHVLVSREERLAGKERLGLPAIPALTHASLLRLGEEVDADWVVFGRFEVQDGQLTAQARLFDVRRLALSPLLEERGSFAQLLEVQGRLAWRILRSLDPTFPFSQQAFLLRFPLLRVSAFESYVRGLLALSRQQQGRYFLQAARLDPHFSLPAYRLAQLYFDDQDYSNAALWFARIPADDSLALDARFYLSLCQFFARDYDHAAETLAPLAERLPVQPVWNNLGVFASRQGRGQEAVGYFARALEADPADADVYFNLGLHHLRRAEWAPAREALEHCLQLNPGDTEAQFLRAQALERLGHIPEADRARQQAVGDNPALALSLERRQLNLDRLEQQFSARLAGPARPRQESAAAASNRDQHVTVHLVRGADLLARGDLDPARQEFTQAILLDPDSPRAHSFLAEVYQRQGRLPEAIAELKALLWSQESVPARLRLAEIYLAQNRPAEAREQVRAALAVDPTNAAARALESRLAAAGAPTPAEGTKP